MHLSQAVSIIHASIPFFVFAVLTRLMTPVGKTFLECISLLENLVT